MTARAVAAQGREQEPGWRCCATCYIARRYGDRWWCACSMRLTREIVRPGRCGHYCARWCPRPALAPSARAAQERGDMSMGARPGWICCATCDRVAQCYAERDTSGLGRGWCWAWTPRELGQHYCASCADYGPCDVVQPRVAPWRLYTLHCWRPRHEPRKSGEV